MYNLDSMAQFRRQGVFQKRNCVSECFARKLEFKLKIAIDFSSRKKEKPYFLFKIFKLRLWITILMSSCGFPLKYKNPLKGKKKLY